MIENFCQIKSKYTEGKIGGEKGREAQRKRGMWIRRQ
jgi:hypothetical protein